MDERVGDQPDFVDDFADLDRVVDVGDDRQSSSIEQMNLALPFVVVVPDGFVRDHLIVLQRLLQLLHVLVRHDERRAKLTFAVRVRRVVVLRADQNADFLVVVVLNHERLQTVALKRVVVVDDLLGTGHQASDALGNGRRRFAEESIRARGLKSPAVQVQTPETVLALKAGVREEHHLLVVGRALHRSGSGAFGLVLRPVEEERLRVAR